MTWWYKDNRAIYYFYYTTFHITQWYCHWKNWLVPSDAITKWQLLWWTSYSPCSYVCSNPWVTGNWKLHNYIHKSLFIRYFLFWLYSSLLISHNFQQFIETNDSLSHYLRPYNKIAVALVQKIQFKWLSYMTVNYSGISNCLWPLEALLI